MSYSRERNDRGAPAARAAPGRQSSSGGRRREGRGGGSGDGESDWLWGRHAVEAACANPERQIRKLIATADRAKELEPIVATRANGRDLNIEIREGVEIARLLPTGAAHQGCALLSPPLEDVGVDALAEAPHGVIVVLDQVTDPQNVGAVLRSAAAFGARGMIVQDRHAPKLAGAAAKAAAGAVEQIPVVRVVNLSRALERLADRGWRAVGLSGDAPLSLEEALDGGPTVLVMGSEGDGMRRLVAEHCDALAHIAMPGGFESLNVSAAAAVALYAATVARKT